MSHPNLFNARTVIYILIGVCGSEAATVVSRVATREIEELPGLGADAFGYGADQIIAFFYFEECEKSVGRGDGQGNAPCQPV